MTDVNYSRIQIARRGAFRHQHGKCYYCKCEMWEPTIETKHEAAHRLFDLPLSKAGVKRMVANSKATAEHLVKQADGGTHQNENIVAACMDCNTRRGDMTVKEYRLMVQEKANA